MRSVLAITVSMLALAVACENKDTKDPKTTTPITPSTDTTPTPSVSVAATAPTPTPTPTPSAVPSATTPAPTTSAAAATARKDAGSSSATVAALKPAAKHVNGKNFALDLASPGCKASEDCAMTIKLTAAGDFHVNKEYPYKFVASPQPNVVFLGKGDANTFGRASGDFVEQGEKNALLTVRFKPSAAGEAKVTGTYKMSVCSAEQCQIETETVDLSIPVM